MGKPLVNLFDLTDLDGTGERTLMFHLSTRSAFHDLPVRAVTTEDRCWSISGRPIYDEYNNFIGFRGSGTDLTERKKSEEEVSRLANFDSLTVLANRFQISQVLSKILNSVQIDNRAPHDLPARPRPVQACQRYAGPPGGRCLAANRGAAPAARRRQAGAGGPPWG